MKKISSAQNPRLKAAVRLKTSRGRKTQQRIIVFGQRELLRAMQSGIRPLEIFLSSEMLDQEEFPELIAELPEHTDVFDLPASLMNRLKYGDRADGVVAIAQRPELKLNDLKLVAGIEPPLVVVLESIEKPGNIGAVLRTVDGAGASAVILSDPKCDVLHPNCIRASMGSVFTIPLAIASGRESINWLCEQGISICSLTDAGQTPWADMDWTKPVAVVLGSEAGGLTQPWLEPPCRTVAIPMQGISDSLNVSVAAGVALYEARRQRQKPNDGAG